MLDLYEPKGLALEIFQKRYALHDQESFAEACDRVAAHIAAAETNGNVMRYRTEFSALLKSNLFMPGGRIWYGSGRPKGQLLNCFVAPISDSREGWGKAVYDEIVICGTGGGLGINFSPVRPRGSEISGHKGTATGAVSPMEIIDAAGERLKAGGGRRTALMFALALNHGDIIEFLDKKLDLGQLNNANVSVWFADDPEKFFEMVKVDGELELKHRGRTIGTLRAVDVWQKIVGNALKTGEPGLLNGYLFNRMSNVWYHKNIISTNPCGEVGLSEYESCDLGALVLPRFIVNGEIDWKLLKRSVKLGHRFLDDVLTVNSYPLPEIKEACSALRRVGLGIMGLHDMLLMLGQRYGSAEGLETVDRVMNFIKVTAYESSIDLAKEKGPFPAFDAEKFLKGGFAKTLKPSLRDAIRQHGVRNCANLTIAPTGTSAMVCDVTSGIEPMFAAAYERRWRDGDELKVDVVVHPLFGRFVVEGRDVEHFQGAHELSIRDHLEMQRTCQKHVDNAVSKTLNARQGTSMDELSDLFMEYFPELKGVTIYPEGSRSDQPLTPLGIDEALSHVLGSSGAIGQEEGRSCRSGVCEL